MYSPVTPAPTDSGAGGDPELTRLGRGWRSYNFVNNIRSSCNTKYGPRGAGKLEIWPGLALGLGEREGVWSMPHPQTRGPQLGVPGLPARG